MMKFPAKYLIGRRRPLAACLLAVALALAVSACGSSSSSSSASSGTGVAGATGTGSSTQVQARLNLAKCFRAHGLNVPDPSTGGGVAGGGGFFRTLNSFPQAQVTAARQACQQYFAQAFPRANLSPAQRAQLQQQAVKFAECMRSHGINIPDPTPNANGGFGLGRTLRSVDQNSPAFKAALTACQSLRPRFGGGGGGGGGAVGGGTGA
jgi:hypothetical protein